MSDQAGHEFNPQRMEHEGKILVNRDWIIDYTGVTRTTVSRWYRGRDKTPEGRPRHPDRAARIGRCDWWDQDAFVAWYDEHRTERRAALRPVDSALYAGDADDVVAIHDAAAWLGFAGSSVIHKYLTATPGYFPEPVTTAPGRKGWQVPAFRRGDLWDFDQRRGGHAPDTIEDTGGPEDDET